MAPVADAEPPVTTAPSEVVPPVNTPIAAVVPTAPGKGRIYAGILITFAIINGIILFLLRGVDDELKWSQELRAADDAFAAGRAQEAADALVRFGDRWPDAKKTFGYNEKAGRYFAAADDWSRAAEHFDRAATIRPSEENIAAAAAEAHWKLGNRERAINLWKREILSGNPDNDLANLRLAQRFIEDKDYIRAGEFLQAVRDRQKFAAELKVANETIDTEVLTPARKATGIKE